MEPYFKDDLVTLYCGDCMEAMRCLPDGSVDVVITSPPYNTCRDGTIASAKTEKDKWHQRYDVLLDCRTSDEYMEWSAALFREFGRILGENRIVLYNFGLGNDSQTGFGNEEWFRTVVAVCDGSPFTVADLLFWKKKCALPNNMSPNKSTRIAEPVIVFCRKGERDTFLANKRPCGSFETGQRLYSPFMNVFEARNNDGPNDLNKATYSTQFVDRLIDLYCPEDSRRGWTVLDPFSGTGTTGAAAIARGMKYIGMEMSERQCEYTVRRYSDVQTDLF